MKILLESTETESSETITPIREFSIAIEGNIASGNNVELQCLVGSTWSTRFAFTNAENDGIFPGGFTYRMTADTAGITAQAEYVNQMIDHVTVDVL